MRGPIPQRPVFALFAGLIAHTFSMGFLVGTATVINLRVLGLVPQTPLPMFLRFRPVLVWSIAVSIVSGIWLVAGYPAKALLNPLFYIKLAILVAGLVLTRSLWRRASELDPTSAAPMAMRRQAVLSVMLLVAGLTSGKFLAYTAKVLLL